MLCPNFSELPNTTDNKSGWLWENEYSEVNNKPPIHEDLPKFTIVMPCLNRVKFIEEAVRSVLLQGYPDIEFIVVDGGSTDGTINILKKYSHWLDIIVDNDEGLYDALNIGIRHANGEIVGLLNSDDVLTEGCLKKVGEYFLKNSSIEWLEGEGEVLKDKRLFRRSSDTNNHDSILAAKLAGGSLCFNACFWRKDVFNQIGMFNTSYRVVADRDFLVRAALGGISHMRVEDVLYLYKAHEDSITFTSNREIKLENLKERAGLMELHLQSQSMSRLGIKYLHAKYSELAIRLVLRCTQEKQIMNAFQYFKKASEYDNYWPLKFISGIFKKLKHSTTQNT